MRASLNGVGQDISSSTHASPLASLQATQALNFAFALRAKSWVNLRSG